MESVRLQQIRDDVEKEQEAAISEHRSKGQEDPQSLPSTKIIREEKQKEYGDLDEYVEAQKYLIADNECMRRNSGGWVNRADT